MSNDIGSRGGVTLWNLLPREDEGVAEWAAGWQSLPYQIRCYSMTAWSVGMYSSAMRYKHNTNEKRYEKSFIW